MININICDEVGNQLDTTTHLFFWYEHSKQRDDVLPPQYGRASRIWCHHHCRPFGPHHCRPCNHWRWKQHVRPRDSRLRQLKQFHSRPYQCWPDKIDKTCALSAKLAGGKPCHLNYRTAPRVYNEQLECHIDPKSWGPKSIPKVPGW